MVTRHSQTVLGVSIMQRSLQRDTGLVEWLTEIAEFDHRGDWAADGCRSMVHWLSYFCRMSRPTAKDKLRVALALRTRPLLAAALADGRLTSSHVRAITRLRDAGPAVDTALIEAAQHGTVEDVERIVRHGRLLEDQDHPVPPESRWEQRGLRFIPRFDGLETIEITALPDESGRIAAVIDALLDHEFFAAATTQIDDDAVNTAITERIRHLRAVPEPVDSAESVSPADPKHRRTIAQRRFDALLDLLEAGVAKLDDGGDIDVERAALNVMIDYQTLLSDTPGTAETNRGTPLTGEAARRLACDAGYHRIITHGRSLVLDVGRKTQQWNAAQRRAIRARHGHQCCVGGCGARITQIHHITFFSQGGETNVSGGLPVCGFHHRLVHDHGWRLTYDPATGITTLTNPDGAPVITTPCYDANPLRRSA